MNNRMRQQIKAEIMIAKLYRVVYLKVPGRSYSYVLLIHKDDVEEYKRKYGDLIEVFAEEG